MRSTPAPTEPRRGTSTTLVPRFGFITHVRADRDGADSGALYRDTIELAVHAERCGFSSFWIAQHHFGSQRSHLPAPLVMLAAIAAHTERIRLGTAIIVGSIDDPIRLAEDAAVVDQLSGGRLELGLGAGADPATAARFGRDHAARHETFESNLDVLLGLLTGDELVPSAPGLRERLWIGTSSERGYALAARLGIGVLTGRSSSPDGPRAGDERSALAVTAYRAATEEAGFSARVGLSRPVFAARSQEATYAALGPGISEWVQTCHANGRLPESFTADDYLQTGHMYVGTADDALRGVRSDPVYPLATDVLLNTQPCAPTAEAVREHLSLVAAAARLALPVVE